MRSQAARISRAGRAAPPARAAKPKGGKEEITLLVSKEVQADSTLPLRGVEISLRGSRADGRGRGVVGTAGGRGRDQ